MSGGLKRARRVLRQRGAGAVALGAIDEVRSWRELQRRKRCDPVTFVVDGVRRTQFVHLHNRTWRNERAVEIPLAMAFLEQQQGPVLEVGNVLANYGRTGHTVVDKYEKEPGVLNVDIVDFQPTQRFGAIVSISTLEHVGWDEEPRDAAKIPLAITHLRGLLAPSGRLFVTCPISYNPHLDALVTNGDLRADRQAFLAKRDNSWTQVSLDEALTDASLDRYGATAIWVAEFSP